MDIDAISVELGLQQIEPLARDVSPREYFKVQKGGENFVLMAYHEVCNQVKNEMESFLKIDEWLLSQGLKAPAVHAVSQEKGYILLEDLGNISFGRALHEGCDGFHQDRLYMLACDVLKKLRISRAPEKIPLYEDSRIYANRRQIIDYYFPLKLGKMSDEKLVADYISIWNGITNNLPPCPRGFVHGDFHLENMMVCTNETGLKCCGLIDFQDALNGLIPYDLVNLLEDARVDVPHSLRQAVLLRYCEGMEKSEKDIFLKWYRVLGTQFHGRVLGLFIKLAAEQRRDKYLIHIERLQNYMIEGLKDPILLPLKQWFDKQGVDFLPVRDMNGDAIRTVFRNIAC